MVSLGFYPKLSSGASNVIITLRHDSMNPVFVLFVLAQKERERGHEVVLAMGDGCTYRRRVQQPNK